MSEQEAIGRTAFERAARAIRWRVLRHASAEKIYLVLIPTIGLVTGAAALAIAHLLVVLQDLLWGNGEQLLTGVQSSSWAHRLLVPALGGCFVALLAWILRRDVRGAGTAGLMETIALRGGRISVRREMPAVLAGIATVSSGGSLGREGPMVELASVIGSSLGRIFDLEAQQVRVLVCCAAAAAISAVYNAPIGGSIFVMEILIGTFALDVFGPVVIASVLSTFVFRASSGQLPRFVIPSYELVSAWEIPAYAVLGILCGVFSVLVIEFIGSMGEALKKLIPSSYVRPLVGFTLLGALGIPFPYVFGNGYETVNLALHEQLPLTLLLVLPLMKLFATALTRASGGSGGVFTPTLMLGALVGGAFGYGVHAAFPTLSAEHGAYAIVGMGSVLAGTTHAPIMAIMMIFEQTNSYPIILPLMLACIVSNQVARRIKPESLHVDALRRRGVELDIAPEASVMRSLRVADAMQETIEAVRESAPFSEVVAYFLNNPRNFLWVVDEDGRFSGAIPLHAIKSTLTAAPTLDVVLAADLVEPMESLEPGSSLAEAMEAFWRQHTERLPVVESGSTKLIGWLSQRDIIGIYSQEILNKRHLLARFTMPDASGADRTGYVELPQGFSVRTFIVPASLEGRTIGSLAPRALFGVDVLQIRRFDPFRRRQAPELPGASSLLKAYDRIVVIGPRDGLDRMQVELHLTGEGAPAQ